MWQGAGDGKVEMMRSEKDEGYRGRTRPSRRRRRRLLLTHLKLGISSHGYQDEQEQKRQRQKKRRRAAPSADGAHHDFSFVFFWSTFPEWEMTRQSIMTSDFILCCVCVERSYP